MTPGSEAYRAELLESSDRFGRAVSRSFAFLTTLGFSVCSPQVAGLDDLRDAIATHRYIRDQKAVDIDFSLLTRQVSVVLFTYEAPATCETNQRFTSAVELEAWLLSHARGSLLRLPWMRKETLAEEMKPSINAFVRKMDLNLESVVDWLAQRLQNSGLLTTV